MEASNTDSLIDPKSGFCSVTKTYHSLRPDFPLPPPSQPLSITQYILSHHQQNSSIFSDRTCLIDADTGHRVSYSEFLRQANSLAVSLTRHYWLSKCDVAFILSPNSIHIPILYFSLLSIGVVVSPTDPDESVAMITHGVQLSRATIAFATTRISHKLPSGVRTIVIDSPEFLSMLTHYKDDNTNHVEINQSDIAMIMYTSGTTGRSKGVLLTHRNFIAAMASRYRQEAADHEQQQQEVVVSVAARALTYLYGLTVMLLGLFVGGTLVVSEGIYKEFEQVLKAVEKYKANMIPASPSFITQLVKSESITSKYDLKSMTVLLCSGAPLGNELVVKCRQKYPNVLIIIVSEEKE